MTTLIDAARGGDRRAFESLYRQHVGRVYAVCLRLTAHVRDRRGVDAGSVRARVAALVEFSRR